MDNVDANTERPKARLPYQTPVLQVLGSLAELTGMIGTVGMADGGMGMMRRSG